MKIEEKLATEYKYGFVTDIESEDFPKGLSEDIVRLISAKKNEPEWLLEYRLKSYRHWLTLEHPEWQYCKVPPINFQDIYFYSKPKSKKDVYKSLEDVDTEHLPRGTASTWNIYRGK